MKVSRRASQLEAKTEGPSGYFSSFLGFELVTVILQTFPLQNAVLWQRVQG